MEIRDGYKKYMMILRAGPMKELFLRVDGDSILELLENLARSREKDLFEKACLETRGKIFDTRGIYWGDEKERWELLPLATEEADLIARVLRLREQTTFTQNAPA